MTWDAIAGGRRPRVPPAEGTSPGCVAIGTRRHRRVCKLPDARPDAPQVRPAWNPPVHPDADGAPHEMVLRHESNLGEAAVLTVVAVVAHEEIVPGRHHGVEIDSHALRCQHDLVIGR